MTLEQTFPGLRRVPGGAIVALADNPFDLQGPAVAMQAEIIDNWALQVRADIKALDPHWSLPRLGPIPV